MKKYLSAIIILLIAALSVIALTSDKLQSVDRLMRPPRIEGENSEIQVAFEESVGDKYSLRSPLSGNYRSSFIMFDLNDDGDDEVIVFYCVSSATEVIRMNILDKIDGKWTSISDFESSHNDVHQIDFADLDNDGIKEIVVGWSMLDQELKNTINVYRLNSKNEKELIESIFTREYSEYIICDINNDGEYDVLVFEKTTNSDITGFSASYIDFKGGKAYIAAEYYVDPIIGSIASISYDGDNSDHARRFFIDGYTADGGMTTDLFYWDNDSNKFARYDLNENKSVSYSASRTVNIYCSDINSDSEVEIPFEIPITESEIVSSEKSIQKQQNIISWMKIDDYGFTAVKYEIVNPSKGYSVHIKDEDFGKFTVKNNLDTGVMTFYELYADDVPGFMEEEKPKKKKDDVPYEPGMEERPGNNAQHQEESTYTVGEPLFSIFTTNDKDPNLYELSGYRFIKSSNGYSYYCQIHDAGRENGINKETVKEILITKR